MKESRAAVRARPSTGRVYGGRRRRDPALAAAPLFGRRCAPGGHRGGRRARRGTRRRAQRARWRAQSPPLAAIVRYMDPASDNFAAELLLKQLGAVAGGAGNDRGRRRRRAGVLAAAGIPLAGVRIVDGSGLSLLDRVTARALVGVLRAALGRPRAPPGLPRRCRSRRTPGHSTSGSGGRRPGERPREDGNDVASPRRSPATSAAATCSRSSRTAARSRGRGRARAQDRFVTAASRQLASFEARPRRAPARRAAAPSRASSPGSRRRSRPVVFFETESATLAPIASSAARASSR